MKAIVYEGIKDVKVKRVEDPSIKNADDIIIRVTSTAICGSDLHLIHGMVPNMPKGFILGHETMGIVEEAGKEVHRFDAKDIITHKLSLDKGEYAYDIFDSKKDNCIKVILKP